MSLPILFDKRIEEIKLEDIQNLQTRRISEGLYVEYKSDFQTPVKISHSIASFANTHGGWYFVGIKCGSDNVAAEFNGIELAIHSKPIEDIRNIIIGNISPIPLFFTRFLEINSERGILMVHVPESFETPHITKDGRIYRRNGEGSDPVAENDRYTIDRLYEKNKLLDYTVENFSRRQFVSSKAQENQGWLEVYLLTHPFDKLFVKDFFETKYIDELYAFLKTDLKISESLSMGIPFNNVTTSLDAINFRQTTVESLTHLTLTFQWFRNGNAKALIPFNYIDVHNLENTVYSSSESLKRLSSFLEPLDLASCKIVDGWNLYDLFTCMLGKYGELLKRSKWEDEILVRYRLVNTWRHILFFDSPSYTSYLDSFGVPICLINESEIPDRPTRNFIRASMPGNALEFSGQFCYVIECLGFQPMSFADMIKEGWNAYLQKMQKHGSSH